jgi:predicted phage-related endonuclease
MGMNELVGKVRELKELQVFIKQLEEEADAAKAAIIAEMEARKADTLNVDVFTVKYTKFQSTRLDTTRFRAEHGDLYSAYSKTSEARRFSIA